MDWQLSYVSVVLVVHTVSKINTSILQCIWVACIFFVNGMAWKMHEFWEWNVWLLKTVSGMHVSFIREAFIAVNIRGSWVNKKGKELPGISHCQQTFPQTIFKAIQKAIFR